MKMKSCLVAGFQSSCGRPAAAPNKMIAAVANEKGLPV